LTGNLFRILTIHYKRRKEVILEQNGGFNICSAVSYREHKIAFITLW